MYVGILRKNRRSGEEWLRGKWQAPSMLDDGWRALRALASLFVQAPVLYCIMIDTTDCSMQFSDLWLTSLLSSPTCKLPPARGAAPRQTCHDGASFLKFLVIYRTQAKLNLSSNMKHFVIILAFIFSVETALASRQSTLVHALARQSHTAFIRPDHDVIRFADGDEESTAFVRQCVGKNSIKQTQRRFTRKGRQQQHRETSKGTSAARKVNVASASTSTTSTANAKNPIIQYGEYMPLYTGY